MKLSNSVLKLTLKSRGDSLIWHHPETDLKPRDWDAYFPRIQENLYGPNLALTSERISQRALFLTVTSAWNLKDEFGRRGLFLSQGLIVNFNPQDQQSIGTLCKSFSRLLDMYRVRYQTLGELLSYLAAVGGESEAKKLAYEVATSFTQLGSESDASLLPYLIKRLQHELKLHNTRLRIHTSFPWSADLGFISLLGLQASGDDIRSIGGGYLDTYKPYQHISTESEIPEFASVDLNEAMASKQLDVKPEKQPEQKTLSNKEPETSPIPPTIKTALIKFLTIFPTLSSIVVLVIALYTLQNNQRFIKDISEKFEAGIPRVNSDTNQGSHTETPKSTTPPVQPTEDPLLSKIAKLYDRDQKVRKAAIIEVSRDSKSNEKVVPALLNYALENKDNRDGIENSFLIFQGCKPQVVKQSKDNAIAFLNVVKATFPKKTKLVDRMQKTLNSK